MPVNTKTNYGQIKIADNAIAALAGTAVAECYGVVGMTGKNIRDGINYLLKKENYSKGVIVRNKNNGIEIDLYTVLIDGVRIPEVVNEIQKRVKYSLEKTLNMDVLEVNVYVESIRVLK